MAEEIVLTRLVRIYPNATTRRMIDKNIIYRNEAWNRAINQWEYDYRDCQKHIKWITFKPHTNKKGTTTVKEIKHYNRKCPSKHVIRDEMVKQKKNMDYMYPSGILDGVATDLQHAFDAFFDPKRPNSGYPKIKRKNMDQGSYYDSRSKIVNNKLHLIAPWKDPKRKRYSDIKISEKISEEYQNVRLAGRVIRHADKYYYAFPVKREIKKYMPTGQVDGVDVNSGHFNSAGVHLNVLPKKLDRQYDKIKCYNRKMARKRVVNGYRKAQKSHNYQKLRVKLNQAYQCCSNIQHDIVKKYVHYLVVNRDRVTIEDLNVKGMLMGHIAAKGVHKSMFRYFRDTITYMGKIYGCDIVLAHRLFASTQECPRCHYIKIKDDKITLEGNKKHNTDHDEYTCYNCGYTADRDDGAYQSLAIYDADESYEWYKEIRRGEENEWKLNHPKQ